jgi:hypothetical protein
MLLSTPADFGFWLRFGGATEDTKKIKKTNKEKKKQNQKQKKKAKTQTWQAGAFEVLGMWQ